MARSSRFRDSKNYEDQLRERTEAATKTKSGKFKPIFREDAKFDRWVCAPGEHTIDIIPFLDVDGSAHYNAELLVHTKVGPDENNYVCPKTWDAKAPCGICDAREKIKRIDSDIADDMAKLIDTKERVIYNIVCYDTGKEERKGVQVWDASIHLAEKNFKAASKVRKRSGSSRQISFADPDDGRTILFERVGAKHLTRYESIQFDERPEPISDEILEQAYDLFELLYYPTEEELQEAGDSHIRYTKQLIKDEEEEDEPRGRGRGRGRDKDDDDDDRPRGRTRRNRDDDDDDRGRGRRRGSDEEEEGSRRGRGRGRDEEEDEPRGRSRRGRDREDEQEEDNSRRTRRNRDDKEEEEESPRSRRSRNEDKEERSSDDNRNDKEESSRRSRRSRDDESEKESSKDNKEDDKGDDEPSTRSTRRRRQTEETSEPEEKEEKSGKDDSKDSGIRRRNSSSSEGTSDDDKSEVRTTRRRRG